jgi:hypothetical protein
MLIVFALPGGCSLSSARVDQLPAEGADLPVLREKRGVYSSFEERKRLVIHDVGSMATVPVDPGPVDFDREMVVVAALGPAPSPDYGIRIRGVKRQGSRLRAAVEVQYPPMDAPRRGRPSSPYHLIVVPKCHLNIVGFETRNLISQSRP